MKDKVIRTMNENKYRITVTAIHDNGRKIHRGYEHTTTWNNRPTPDDFAATFMTRPSFNWFDRAFQTSKYKSYVDWLCSFTNSLAVQVYEAKIHHWLCEQKSSEVEQ